MDNIQVIHYIITVFWCAFELLSFYTKIKRS